MEGEDRKRVAEVHKAMAQVEDKAKVLEGGERKTSDSKVVLVHKVLEGGEEEEHRVREEEVEGRKVLEGEEVSVRS